MKRILTLGALALSTVTFASCGYALAGRGSYLPSYIQTIGIPLFVNNTPYFEVEQGLTQKVRSEFIGRGSYRVLPQATDVDAVLSAEIQAISLGPAAFTEQQQVSRYVITMQVKLEFRDLKTNNVLWQNDALIFREEYDVTSTSGAFESGTFFGQDSNALERVATDFARTVVSAILEAF